MRISCQGRWERPGRASGTGSRDWRSQRVLRTGGMVLTAWIERHESADRHGLTVRREPLDSNQAGVVPVQILKRTPRTHREPAVRLYGAVTPPSRADAARRRDSSRPAVNRSTRHEVTSADRASGNRTIRLPAAGISVAGSAATAKRDAETSSRRSSPFAERSRGPKGSSGSNRASERFHR